MRSLNALFFTVFLAATALPLAAGKRTADILLAEVAGVRITASDLRQHLAATPILATQAQLPGGLRDALEDYITVIQLNKEGQRRGWIEVAADQERDDTNAFKVRSRFLLECYRLDESLDKENYYRAHPEWFSTPRFVKSLRIGRSVEREDARELLTRLREQLQQGSIEFADAVEKYSEDAVTVDYGGKLGYTPIVGESETEKLLSQAQIGDLVGPVRQDQIWMLYKVEGIIPPELQPFDPAEVYKVAKHKCLESRLDSLIKELRARWPVTYNFEPPLTFKKLNGG